jgi:hypothetical protein
MERKYGQREGVVFTAAVSKLVYKYNNGLPGNATGFGRSLHPAQSGSIAAVHARMCEMVLAHVVSRLPGSRAAAVLG